jgi:hypothetical protein
VHQINRTVPLLKGDVNPLKGGTLVVDEAFFKPTTSRQIHPAAQALKIKRREGSVEIELPAVDVHSVIVLEG